MSRKTPFLKALEKYEKLQNEVFSLAAPATGHGPIKPAPRKEQLAAMAKAKVARQELIDLVHKTIGGEVATLYCASGCNCCRDDKTWEATSAILGKHFNVPKFNEAGYHPNWYNFRDEYKQTIKGQKR